MKDVHTEHCCVIHGCKYGEEEQGCTVYDCFKEQSYPCERCEEEGITSLYLTYFHESFKKERREAIQKHIVCDDF